jgi:hypothetical protein
MSKSWRTIAGFAVLGLAVAAICYAYAATYDYGKSMSGLQLTLSAISMILCPPQLLFAACIDCEVVGRDGLIMYSIIAVLNVAVYAGIGFVVTYARNRRSGR